MLKYKRDDGFLVFQDNIPDEYKKLAEKEASDSVKRDIKLMGKYSCIGICYNPKLKKWGVMDIAPFSEGLKEKYNREIVIT